MDIFLEVITELNKMKDNVTISMCMVVFLAK